MAERSPCWATARVVLSSERVNKKGFIIGTWEMIEFCRCKDCPRAVFRASNPGKRFFKIRFPGGFQRAKCGGGGNIGILFRGKDRPASATVYRGISYRYLRASAKSDRGESGGRVRRSAIRSPQDLSVPPRRISIDKDNDRSSCAGRRVGGASLHDGFAKLRKNVRPEWRWRGSG